MIALSSILFTRRARIVVPFVIAYGLGIYLVAGTVTTAFSGQGTQSESDLVIATPEATPASERPTVDPATVDEAVAVVEQAGALDGLVGHESVEVVSTGAWTADESNPAAPAPEAGVGVAMTVALPEATDIDPSALPGTDPAERSLTGASRQLERGVTSLLVLYDPSTDEIVAVHPIPREAPDPPSDLGPAPEVATSDAGVGRDRPGRGTRGEVNRRASEVRARG